MDEQTKQAMIEALMQTGQYGPMYSPEDQQDMLRRQAIAQSYGPLDLLMPMGIGGAVGGAIGSAAGRGMAHGGNALLNALMPMMAAPVSRGFNALSRGIGGTAGAMAGTGAGLNYADQRILDANMPPRPRYPSRAPDIE